MKFQETYLSRCGNLSLEFRTCLLGNSQNTTAQFIHPCSYVSEYRSFIGCRLLWVSCVNAVAHIGTGTGRIGNEGTGMRKSELKQTASEPSYIVVC